MDIEELMVGAWMYSSFSNYPCKVTHIGITENETCSVGVTNVFGLKDIASLTPITLTEEFFEKNGIKKVDYDYLKPNVLFESEDKRIRVTDLTNNGEGYWNVHIDNEDFDTIGACDVKYVHQFQQLLRLCGYKMDVVFNGTNSVIFTKK